MEAYPKRILIFGIGGQDGSYLADQLLQNTEYQVHGIVRRAQNQNLRHLQNYIEEGRLVLHLGEITESKYVKKIIAKILPQKIFNLAAQSFVKYSFQAPKYTSDVNYGGLVNICDGIQEIQKKQNIICKLFHASTSQMYGVQDEGTILDENSTMEGVSPYGEAKLKAHLHCIKMRKQNGLFVSTAISFNHESERRPSCFVTRKVTKYIARYKNRNGNIKPLQIGNLNAIRDWGHSKDYIKGFMKILDLENADDFVISTGQAYSVRFLIEYAFKQININIEWQKNCQNEKGICSVSNKVLVVVNPDHFRQKQVPYLRGNCKKLIQRTNWSPSITFEKLIKQMVQYDIRNSN